MGHPKRLLINSTKYLFYILGFDILISRGVQYEIRHSKTPIFVWLLIFALIQIFALSSFLPEPFDTRSLLPMGVLTGCSIRVSSEVKDQDGQYAPFKYLWWVILGWTVIGILFGITIKAPLELHIALIVHAIAGE